MNHDAALFGGDPSRSTAFWKSNENYEYDINMTQVFRAVNFFMRYTRVPFLTLRAFSVLRTTNTTCSCFIMFIIILL